MDTWINALKAPFANQSALAADKKPSSGQIAIVWGGIGLLLARVL